MCQARLARLVKPAACSQWMLRLIARHARQKIWTTTAWISRRVMHPAADAAMGRSIPRALVAGRVTSPTGACFTSYRRSSSSLSTRSASGACPATSGGCTATTMGYGRPGTCVASSSGAGPLTWRRSTRSAGWARRFFPIPPGSIRRRSLLPCRCRARSPTSSPILCISSN